MFKTVKGLVLRETKYKEADKILTVLTESEGKLTVKARGALRKSCRFSASAQFLAYSDMTLFGNRGRWSLDEAQSVELFNGLRSDLELLALASYFAELLEALSDADSPTPELLRLGLNSLYALSEKLCKPEQVKAAFELRLMCMTGFEPALEGCVQCHEVNITHPVFCLGAGTLRCAQCRDPEPGPRAFLCADSLAAARYIVGAPLRRLFSFSLSDEALRRLNTATEAYLSVQLERSFPALNYYKSLINYG